MGVIFSLIKSLFRHDDVAATGARRPGFALKNSVVTPVEPDRGNSPPPDTAVMIPVISSDAAGSDSGTGLAVIDVGDYDNEENIIVIEETRPDEAGSASVGSLNNIIIIEETDNSVKAVDDEEWREHLERMVAADERWISHYSNRQRILLVGEGDFSFSASLARAFVYAPYLTATSLDSLEYLRRNYSKAMKNIEELRSRGCKVLHEIDATTMANHLSLQGQAFDCIVFNYPYCGGFSHQHIDPHIRLMWHRELVDGFLKNAKKMVTAAVGEIHITHKKNCFKDKWNIKRLARHRGLKVLETVEFRPYDYPGYRTKEGFAGDGNLFMYGNHSVTCKFGL